MVHENRIRSKLETFLPCRMPGKIAKILNERELEGKKEKSFLAFGPNR